MTALKEAEKEIKKKRDGDTDSKLSLMVSKAIHLQKLKPSTLDDHQGLIFLRTQYTALLSDLSQVKPDFMDSILTTYIVRIKPYLSCLKALMTYMKFHLPKDADQAKLVSDDLQKLDMASKLAKIMYILYLSPVMAKYTKLYAQAKTKRKGADYLTEIEAKLQAFYAHPETYFIVPTSIDQLLLVTSDLVSTHPNVNERVKKNHELVYEFHYEILAASKAIRKAAKGEKRNVQSKLLRCLETRLASMRLLPEQPYFDIDFQMLVDKLL